MNIDLRRRLSARLRHSRRALLMIAAIGAVLTLLALLFTPPPHDSPTRFFVWISMIGLVMVLVERERWQRHGIEALIAERTAALRESNDALTHEIAEGRVARAQAESSQALIVATLQAAPYAIVVMGDDFKVLLWNRAAEEIFGYAAEEVVGRSNPLLDADDAEIRDVRRRLKAGETVRGLPQERRRKDGVSVEIRLSVAPIAPEGKITAFAGILEDVTERNAIQSQLAQAQKMEAIGTLTGGMAHDFNNLLGIIVGNLDLLRPRLDDRPEAAELAGNALDAALRGADLTRRLLAFARRQPLRPQPAALNTLIRETAKLLDRTLGEAVRIALDLSPELWSVTVDAAQLEAALVNLGTNARDAMPRGGVLRIATGNRVLDADYCLLHSDVVPGEYAMIEVGDTGTGMSRDVMRHIFEPFFTTKTQGRGSGLGLSMVFGFIKQSGGHINVYSEPGVGTTFRLYFPRSAAAVREAAAPVDAASPEGRGETVLVVEDNEDLRRIALRQLVDLGYRPLEAADAAAARGLRAREKVELLFTDVVMPGGIDGFELAGRVAARWPAVKIVLTSGFSGAHTGTALDALPATVRLLGKPYRRHELARTLREALTGSAPPA